jgi:hypothetical protein
MFVTSEHDRETAVTAITPTGAGCHCGLHTKEENNERHD